MRDDRQTLEMTEVRMFQVREGAHREAGAGGR